MNIPNLPSNNLLDTNGQMTSEWYNFFSQLITELQLNFGTEGVKPSQLTSTEITDLAAIAAMSPENAAVSNGKIFFDATTSNSTSLKTLINGTLYTINLT